MNTLAAGGLDGFCGLNDTVAPESLKRPPPVPHRRSRPRRPCRRTRRRRRRRHRRDWPRPVPPMPPSPVPPAPPLPPRLPAATLFANVTEAVAGERRTIAVERAAARRRYRPRRPRRRPHPHRRRPRRRDRCRGRFPPSPPKPSPPLPPVIPRPDRQIGRERARLSRHGDGSEIEQAPALGQAAATAGAADRRTPRHRSRHRCRCRRRRGRRCRAALPARSPRAAAGDVGRDVVADKVRLAPAALKTPPPRPAPPAPPMPPSPPTPDWPSFSGCPPIRPRPRLRCRRHRRRRRRRVGRDRAAGDAQRPGRIEDPTPLAAGPAGPMPPVPPSRRSPSSHRSRRWCRKVPIAKLFRIRTEVSFTLPPELRIPPPSPATRPCWIVTLEIDTLPLRISKTRSRLLPSMMVLAAPALDGEVAGDIQVAGGAGVLAGAGRSSG